MGSSPSRHHLVARGPTTKGVLVKLTTVLVIALAVTVGLAHGLLAILYDLVTGQDPLGLSPKARSPLP